MAVKIASNVKFFKLYLRGSVANNWDNIGTFTSLRSQSMTEIFLTRDHKGGIHDASITLADRRCSSCVHNVIIFVNYSAPVELM
jgi:hypothetical protein